jgi:hypothetical protein
MSKYKGKEVMWQTNTAVGWIDARSDTSSMPLMAKEQYFDHTTDSKANKQKHSDSRQPVIDPLRTTAILYSNMHC